MTENNGGGGWLLAGAVAVGALIANSVYEENRKHPAQCSCGGTGRWKNSNGSREACRKQWFKGELQSWA